MKSFTTISLVGLLFCLALSAAAQSPAIRPATVAEIRGGIDNTKGITPAGLSAIGVKIGDGTGALGRATIKIASQGGSEAEYNDISFGPNDNFVIGHTLTNFNGVQDRVFKAGYRANGEYSTVGDICAYMQIEHRFQQTGGAAETEYHFNWFPPDGSGVARRPWQCNISWGPGYDTAGRTMGYTTQSFKTHELRVGAAGDFETNFWLTFPENTAASNGSGKKTQTDLLLLGLDSGLDARLRVSAYGGARWGQFGFGNGGTLLNSNNIVALDVCSVSLASIPTFMIRRSSDIGATYANLLSISAYNSKPGFSFNGAVDPTGTGDTFAFNGTIHLTSDNPVGMGTGLTRAITIHDTDNNTPTIVIGRSGEGMALYAAQQFASGPNSTNYSMLFSNQVAKFHVGRADGNILLQINSVTLVAITSDKIRLTQPLQLASTFVAGAPAATGYLTVQDSAGTTYKLLVAP